MKKYLPHLILALITLNFLLAAWLPLHGDIVFYPDQARDLLLLEYTVKSQPFTLIGPRTLGIEGLFHGPAWMYVNLPAFVLGAGNPAVVGLFWVLLVMAATCGVFWVGRRLFGQIVGLLSALLFSTIFLVDTVQMINPYGAVLLFPLFFYCAVEYAKNNRPKFLVASLILLGFIIQFEMAFGGPVAVVYLAYVLIHIARKKSPRHLFGLLALLLPLSTFLLFEMKHNFFQTHAIVDYMSKVSSEEHFFGIGIVLQRFSEMRVDNIGLITQNMLPLELLLLGTMSWIFYKGVKNRLTYSLFALLYFGYWIVTFFYRGEMWVWYHYALVPVLAIMLSSGYVVMNKKLFLAIFCVFYGVTMWTRLVWFQGMHDNFVGRDVTSWTFFKNAADQVFQKESADFGYYILEDDALGYRGQYAFHYAQGFHPSVRAFSNTKKPHTYIFNATPKDSTWWREHRVHIDRAPDAVVKFDNGYSMERYDLNDEEMAVPSDPNVVDSLIFR